MRGSSGERVCVFADWVFLAAFVHGVALRASAGDICETKMCVCVYLAL